MPVDDLAKITETLIWVLETGMPSCSGWPSGVAATVSPLPPDMKQADGANLGLYLYHVSEDAHFKNPTDTTTRSPAERPLALNLYYQLTATTGDNKDGALRSQTFMSCAMRVLHDHAIITDDSTLNGTKILEPHGLAGSRNRLRIVLRPVPPDDAVDYWTAGEAPLRLAAYYQVSVVMLEPEPTTAAAGPVLSYGTGIFASGAPTLTGSRSNRGVWVADEPAARSVVLRPAQVTLPPTSLPPLTWDQPGTFVLEGSQLTGDGTGLRLRGDYGTYDVDAGQWGLVASATEVHARVAASMDTIPTMPGTWLASVLVRRVVSVGGTATAVVHASNETPILIAPRLDIVSLAAGPTLGSASRSSAFTWTGWRFTGTGTHVIPTDRTDPRAVGLLIGGIALEKIDAPAVPANPGEFRVVDATTLSGFLPDALAVGSIVPVQVRVNGVASTPLWLEVTA